LDRKDAELAAIDTDKPAFRGADITVAPWFLISYGTSPPMWKNIFTQEKSP
jgi:hypothetical protein